MNKIIIITIVVVIAIIGAIFFLNSSEKTGKLSEVDEINETNEVNEEEQEQENIITHTEHGFFPNIIFVSPGTTVTFLNDSPGQMWIAPYPEKDALAGLDQGGEIDPGEEYQFTFTEPGRWEYHNKLLPLEKRMGGTIVVE